MIPLAQKKERNEDEDAEIGRAFPGLDIRCFFEFRQIVDCKVIRNVFIEILENRRRELRRKTQSCGREL